MATVQTPGGEKELVIQLLDPANGGVEIECGLLPDPGRLPQASPKGLFLEQITGDPVWDGLAARVMFQFPRD